MSRKHRTHGTRQKSILLLAVAAGALLLTLAAFLLARQATPEETGNPQIAVDQQRIDFGYVKLGETRQFKIVVTNTGGGVLRFKQKPYVEVLEGC